ILGGTDTISGTSMASPHVAGVGALYKGANGDAASSTVNNWITTNATSGVINNNPAGTPNRLLFKNTL
ncbi:MAG: S8 family serine peptidase, partial [Streptomyces sp.]|uniref:S8 family serine peptidase n=1 Tax=Streptomyces sp. TaxID=1931 RepID=UPI003D6A4746